MLTVLAALTERAQRSPDDIALATPEGPVWTFREVDRAVDAVTAQLWESGIRPRSMVAVDLPPAANWIVSLALLRLAAISLSVDRPLPALPAPVDAVVSDVSHALTVPTIRIDAELLERPPTSSAGRTLLFARPDALCRVILTSGSTGEPRAVALSVAAFEHRLRSDRHYWTDHRRELNLMSLATSGGFHTAASCLLNGTPYLAASRITHDLLDLATKQQIEVLAGSPAQIGHVLALLRDRPRRLGHLREVRLAGAPPTIALRRAISDQLGVAVRSIYGSTEAGTISTTTIDVDDDSRDVGHLIPGVELQVMDADGTATVEGDVGRIRYRTPGLAEGYLRGARLERFQRGWFEPGDLGRIGDEGRLHLSGRESALVNLGGVKVDPAQVEELAESFPGVHEAAAFAIERQPGIVELGLAIVTAEPDGDLGPLDAMLRRALPGRHPTVIGRVARVPRTGVGKIARAALHDEFTRRLSGR